MSQPKSSRALHQHLERRTEQDDVLETVVEGDLVLHGAGTMMSGCGASSDPVRVVPDAVQHFLAVVVGVHREEATAAELVEDRGLSRADIPVTNTRRPALRTAKCLKSRPASTVSLFPGRF